MPTKVPSASSATARAVTWTGAEPSRGAAGHAGIARSAAVRAASAAARRGDMRTATKRPAAVKEFFGQGSGPGGVPEGQQAGPLDLKGRAEQDEVVLGAEDQVGAEGHGVVGAVRPKPDDQGPGRRAQVGLPEALAHEGAAGVDGDLDDLGEPALDGGAQGLAVGDQEGLGL